ncbi:MAG: amidohydrolase [Planctomycetota bacterium]
MRSFLANSAFVLGSIVLSHSVMPVAFSQQADLIIYGANVLKCNPAMDLAEAVAIKDGRIVAVGTDEEITKRWSDPKKTSLLDAKGQTITPGLTDSHLHFLGVGQSLQILDLSYAESWQEIVEQVEQASRTLPKGAWIEGRGWHQSKWNKLPAKQVEGYPDHRTMSDLVPDHPVVLTHASGHALFANAAAMKLADVGPETSEPAGGEILKDDQGQPIGVFRENAGSLIRRAQSRANAGMTLEDRREQFRERVQLASEACRQYGITSVHDAGSSFFDAREFKRMADEGLLPVRMTVMIRAPSYVLKDRLGDSRFVGEGNGFLTVRSVKVSIDGALGPHGAWLLEPYSDLPTSRGLNTVGLDELERVAQLCKKHDWQLCVHAIGDRANREVLDVYEQVLGEDVDGDHRWRIEHAQHLAPSDIPRFGKLGVIPAMQANHCTSDAIFVPTRLGERRSVQGAYVWRSLIDAGAIIPNGTDAPVERIDPRVSLFASITRQLKNGEAFYPDQCMTRAEALLSYTLWPAQAAFQESELGSIEVGKRADLVMWDTNLLTCEPQAILNAEVKRVWIEGVDRSVSE